LLTISTSFGDSWIAGTHTWKRAKTDGKCDTYAQNTRYCVTPSRRAHKPDQTDQTNPGTDLSDIRTHQADTQQKAVARGANQGSADPTWKGLGLRFGGKHDLILQKAVIHVSISVGGGNRPLEL